MSIEVKTFINGQGKSADELGGEIADWLMSAQEFSIKEKQWEGSKFVVDAYKSGFARQLSGLVFEYRIELHPTDNSMVVLVDSGDIRHQAAALGISLIVFWPMLITAGYGMYHTGEFREQIFAKIESLIS